MTIKELKKEMKAIRCIYRGITDDLTAYKVAFKRINWEVGYGKYAEYLLRYNASLYASRTGDNRYGC